MMNTLNIKKVGWFALTFIIIMIDAITKNIAVKYLLPYQSKYICQLLNFTLAYNTGAAFSFLSNAGDWHRWFFAIFSLIMSIILGALLAKTAVKSKIQCAALSLILAGAIGNLHDRLVHGYVIDFIDLHFLDHHWPVFNVADTAICIGAVLLAIDWYKTGKEHEQQQRHIK
jgi:signal peptidase II